jgi:hypothetical protein
LLVQAVKEARHASPTKAKFSAVDDTVLAASITGACRLKMIKELAARSQPEGRVSDESLLSPGATIDVQKKCIILISCSNPSRSFFRLSPKGGLSMAC